MRAPSLVLTLLALALLSATAEAQEPPFRVQRAPEPPNIDGVLDDSAWAQVDPMPTGQWVSYNPNRGDRMPDDYRTEVRIASGSRVSVPV